MRRLALVLALALASALGTAGSAAAGGTVFPLNASPYGVALAGDRVAWVGQAGKDRYHVTNAARNGGDRDRDVFQIAERPGTYTSFMSIAASAERIGVTLLTQRCANCRSRFAEPTTEFRGILSAPLGESPTVVREGCGRGAICSEICTVGTSVDVSEDALAYSVCEPPLRVHDFAAGASPVEREFPDRDSGRIAGSMLAAVQGFSTAPVVVTNWRTGTDLYSAPYPGGDGLRFDHDVQDDGTLVTVESTPDGRQLFRRSPGEPAPHPVGPPLDKQRTSGATVRLVDDRVAYARQQSKDGAFVFRYGVRTLAGEDVAGPVRVEGDLRIDFDGERLLWRTTPCAVTAIAVWDLAGDPPRLPDGQCPFARIVSGSARWNAMRRRVSVELVCPKHPAIGCPGALNGSSVVNQPRVRGFDLDPGEHARIRVPTYRSLCIDAQGRTIARLVLYAQRRNKSSSRTRVRRVVVKGPQPDARPCSA